ncbi:hypothetical protein BDQ17DRAFT_1407790 [Cyathus striatus]|nr:hypothetical protein BDQ17DRAFT_1407790 [Cyathus striatus]
MSSSIHQAYEQELRDIHASLARLTERLANVRPSAYEENIGTMKFQIEGLTREVDQLKSANAQLTSSVKWLQHQNAELERRLSHRKPEIENVVASRARFQKRLANAYKVIKDLLGEGDLESSSSSSSGRHREGFSDTPETITTSSNNNATSCPALLEGSRTPQPRHHQLSEERAVNEPYTTRITVPDKNEESPGSDPTDHGVFIAGSSSASASTSSQSDDPNVVNIHYNKPPGSSRGLCSGPLQWSHIAPPLGIESDEIQAIQRFTVLFLA